MSMQDTMSDMLTRIRNAQMVMKADVEMPSSKNKVSVAKVLEDEGYINGFEVTEGTKPELRIDLKYYDGKAVIEKISRVSRPGLRVYKGADEIPYVKKGLGIVIVSTSRGIMSDHQARAAGIGGELVCQVS